MPIYIDLNELEKGMYENPSDDYEQGWNNALEGVMLAIEPNPDVVEVVRCSNCVYRTGYINQNGFEICPISNMDITDDDFCSFGERKE